MTMAVAAGRRHGLHAVAVAGTLAALAWKPVSWASTGILVAAAAVALLGMADIRRDRLRKVALAPAALAAGLGVCAFALVRLTEEGIGVRLSGAGIAVLVLAGVAEEAFFRGYLHGLLRNGGLRPLATGICTALLFAVIHLPAYGAWVLPIDLAAGAIFAWQREVSGTWAVPAFSHAVANLFQLG